MINKFQKGGKKDVVMQFVEGLAKTLQADPKEVVQIAQQNPDALESAVKAYQETQDMQQAAQAFTQVIQQKTQKAAHGAKLQYFKSLKHQCAEDEELVYYKSGGSLGCGCVKKKMGEGGQTSNNPVDKFKEIRKAQSGTKNYTKDQLAGREPVKVVNGVKYFLNGDGQVVKDPKGKGSAKPGDKNWKTVEQTYDEKTGKMRPATPAEIAQRRKNNQDAYKGKGEGTPQRKKGGELKKNCGGSTLKLKKKGGEVCPKCGKVHAAGMGCVVAKFKYRKLGGLL